MTTKMIKFLNNIFHKCNFYTTDGYKEGSVYVRYQVCSGCNKKREVIIHKGQLTIVNQNRDE